MNSDYPRRSRPKCHPYVELGPAKLGLMASLHSLETKLADAAKTHAVQQSSGDLAAEESSSEDGADAAICSAMQHSDGDSVNDDTDAAKCHAMQQSTDDSPDDDQADAAVCSDLQHSDGDPADEGHADAAICSAVQHSGSDLAAEDDEPDAALAGALQQTQTALAANLPAMAESNTQSSPLSKLLADPEIAAQVKVVQRMIREFRAEIIRLHESYRTPHAAPPVTPKQQQVIELLLGGATDTRAAEVAGVDRTTIWRWKKEHAFQVAFDLARELAFGESVDRLRALAPDAIESLQHHVRSGDQMAAVRLLRLIRVDQCRVGTAHQQPVEY